MVRELLGISTTDYSVGNVVINNGYTYEAILDSFNINPTNLTYWKVIKPYSYISGNPTDSISLQIGPNFAVSNTGLLTASEAVISGNITAITGNIANWIIDGNILKKSIWYSGVRFYFWHKC